MFWRAAGIGRTVLSMLLLLLPLAGSSCGAPQKTTPTGAATSTATASEPKQSDAAVRFLLQDGAVVSGPDDRGINGYTGQKITQVLFQRGGTDDNMADLAGLPFLKELTIEESDKLTPTGLARLGKLRSLESLTLEGTGVTDEALSFLPALTNLRRLDLSRTRITDAGLKQLKNLKILEELNLTNYGGEMNITDAGLTPLAGLTNLKKLDLSRNNITDAGLAQLKGLKQLYQLGLSDTDVQGPGLANLAQLVELKNLYLRGNLNPDSVAALRQKLPQTQITVSPGNTVPRPRPQPARTPVPNTASTRPAAIRPLPRNPDTDHLVLLKTESLSESLGKFHQMYMFGIVNVEKSGVRSGMPLDPSVGTNDLGQISGNRRFLKLLDELGKRPQSEAAARVNAQLQALLDIHAALYEAKLKEVLESGGQVGFSYADHPDAPPDIQGCRLAIFGLALIAGELHLEETHPALVKIADLAVQQRDTLYKSDPANRFYKMKEADRKSRWTEEELDRGTRDSILYAASLYNRQALLAGLLGTLPAARRAKAQDDAQTLYRLTLISKELTHYDAYPIYNFFWEGGRPDFSQGKLVIHYLSPMVDEHFDALRSALSR